MRKNYLLFIYNINQTNKIQEKYSTIIDCSCPLNSFKTKNFAYDRRGLLP